MGSGYFSNDLRIGFGIGLSSGSVPGFSIRGFFLSKVRSSQFSGMVGWRIAPVDYILSDWVGSTLFIKARCLSPDLNAKRCKTDMKIKFKVICVGTYWYYS